MERTQSQEVYSALLQGNKLLHHINYLCSIKNTFYGGAVNHSSKIKLNLFISFACPKETNQRKR
jgi:hypothetical protein